MGSDEELKKEQSNKRKVNLIIIIASIVCLVLLVILLIIFIPRIRSANQTYSFVFINDIHLDPYYIENGSPDDYCRNATNLVSTSFKYGQYGCDTPNATFQSMLKAIPKFFRPLCGVRTSCVRLCPQMNVRCVYEFHYFLLLL